MEFLFSLWVIFSFWIVFGIIAAIVASARNRRAVGWALLYLLLSPLFLIGSCAVPPLRRPASPAAHDRG
jgi:hypothetical protein